MALAALLVSLMLGCASTPAEKPAPKGTGGGGSSARSSSKGGGAESAAPSKGSPAVVGRSSGAATSPAAAKGTPNAAEGAPVESSSTVDERRQAKVEMEIGKLNARWAQENPEYAVQIRFRSLRSGALVVILSQKPADPKEMARQGAALGSEALQSLAPMTTRQVRDEVEKQLRAISGVHEVLIVEK
jgi:hypothetical protein